MKIKKFLNYWAPFNKVEKKPRFNPDASKSFKWLQKDAYYQIQFTTGSIVVHSGMDTVEFGSTKVLNQEIQLAVQVDIIYNQLDTNGEFGLGLPDANTKLPVVNNLAKQKIISKPIFSLRYFKNYSPNHGGELTVGGVGNLRGAQVTYVALHTGTNHYQFKADKITFDGKSLCSNCDVIFDAGSSQLSCPSSIYEKIVQATYAKYICDEGQCLDYVDCTKIKSLPSISYNIGKKNFDLKSEDYIVKITGSKNQVQCILGFVPSNLWSVSVLFLEKFLVVVDQEAMKIGFA